jgi:Modulator of levamisole receptor-1
MTFPTSVEIGTSFRSTVLITPPMISNVKESIYIRIGVVDDVRDRMDAICMCRVKNTSTNVVHSNTTMRFINGGRIVPPLLLTVVFAIIPQLLHSCIGYAADASIPVESKDDHHNTTTTLFRTDTIPTIQQSLPLRNHKSRRITAWTKETYPNPMIHPVQCRSSSNSSDPTRTRNSHRICDPDGLLSLHEIQTLETKLMSFSNDIYNTHFSQSPGIQIQMYIAFVGKVRCI